jgi:biopolymer transport protein ExbD
MEFERQRRDSGDINITPIIDMVFLLLIFFLLTSNFIKDKGIKVNLPPSSSSYSQKQERITINIGQDGLINVNGIQVKAVNLCETLKRSYKEKKTRTVFIRSDKDNTVERLVQVLDIVKESGAEKLTLATKIKVLQGKNKDNK